MIDPDDVPPAIQDAAVEYSADMGWLGRVRLKLALGLLTLTCWVQPLDTRDLLDLGRAAAVASVLDGGGADADSAMGPPFVGKGPWDAAPDDPPDVDVEDSIGTQQDPEVREPSDPDPDDEDG